MGFSIDWLKQYHLLTVILTLIFGVSAVLIIFESQNQETAQFAKKAVNSSTQAVQGESVVSDPAIAAYQNYAQAVAGSIQALAIDLVHGVQADPAKITELEASLLQTKVPLPYQTLHFKLLKLVRNLRANAGQDLDFLQEQLRLLSDNYLWLFSTQNGGQ